MEATQDGIDFFFRIVCVEREGLHNEVEDDQTLIARRRDLRLD